MLCHKTHSLASAICGLNTGSEKKGFGADVAALISARNDFHHGRGPLTDEEIATASKDAQERLQRCMEALSFLTQYPIRLVQDFDLDRRSGQFWLKCLARVLLRRGPTLFYRLLLHRAGEGVGDELDRRRLHLAVS